MPLVKGHDVVVDHHNGRSLKEVDHYNRRQTDK